MAGQTRVIPRWYIEGYPEGFKSSRKVPKYSLRAESSRELPLEPVNITPWGGECTLQDSVEGYDKGGDWRLASKYS
eukprot:207527-Amorphochlora_amoeboformis.AAC.1